MGLKSPFFVFFNSIFYIQMLIMWKYSFVYTNVYDFMNIWIYEYMHICECGKHVGNSRKMWKTRQKMWETCGNVENMWKTCGKLICMYKCAILSPTIQLWVNFFFFLFFYFFIFYFLFFFSCAGTWAGTYVYECSAVVLFNCMLLHVARNVREERAGVPVYLSIRNVCEHLYLIL